MKVGLNSRKQCWRKHEKSCGLSHDSTSSRGIRGQSRRRVFLFPSCLSSGAARRSVPSWVFRSDFRGGKAPSCLCAGSRPLPVGTWCPCGTLRPAFPAWVTEVSSTRGHAYSFHTLVAAPVGQGFSSCSRDRVAHNAGNLRFPSGPLQKAFASPRARPLCCQTPPCSGRGRASPRGPVFAGVAAGPGQMLATRLMSGVPGCFGRLLN